MKLIQAIWLLFLLTGFTIAHFISKDVGDTVYWGVLLIVNVQLTLPLRGDTDNE